MFIKQLCAKQCSYAWDTPVNKTDKIPVQRTYILGEGRQIINKRHKKLINYFYTIWCEGD